MTEQEIATIDNLTAQYNAAAQNLIQAQARFASEKAKAQAFYNIMVSNAERDGRHPPPPPQVDFTEVREAQETLRQAKELLDWTKKEFTKKATDKAAQEATAVPYSTVSASVSTAPAPKKGNSLLLPLAILVVLVIIGSVMYFRKAR